MTEREELESLLAAAEVEERLIEPLARFGSIVLESNRRFNLTGAKTAQDFAPHLVDSLTVVPYLRGPVVDIGSGAGLPAIPAAIASGLPVTMIETTVKKAKFLATMLEEFSLQGEVIAERAEIAAHDPRLRSGFMSGTARAVSAASTVAELVLPLLSVGGRAIFQRGQLEPAEANALADASLMLGGKVDQTIRLEGARRIVLVEKLSPTQIRFPRRTGIPEKRPLCVAR